MSVDGEAGRAGPSGATAERATRYKERLLEAVFVGLPVVLINLANNKLASALTAQPWHVLWLVAPLVALAWFIWRRVERRQAIRVGGPRLVFLVCYLSVFTLCATSDLLVWKRTTATFGAQDLPRNWLLPAGWGDWHYQFARRPPALDSELVVVTMARPGTGATRDAVRFELARLIEFAAQSGARGVALDFYFGQESSNVDGFLCKVIDQVVAGHTPVVVGQRVVRSSGGLVRFQTYGRMLDACIKADQRALLLAYQDGDGVIRQVAHGSRRLSESTSLSFKVAQLLNGSLALPTGSLLQFVDARDTLPLVAYEWLIQHPHEAADWMRHRFVLVGERSDAETFRTPFGMKLGVQIHAAAVNSLLTRAWIERPPWWWGLLLIVIACYTIVVLAEEGMSAGRLALLASAISLFLIAAGAMAMRLWLVWLDVSYALVAIWLLLGLVLALRKRVRPPAEAPL